MFRGAWEETYTLKLDLDEFDRWIQKDVNNYVAVGVDGHIKVKGWGLQQVPRRQVLQQQQANPGLENLPVTRQSGNMDDPALYQYILKEELTLVVDGEETNRSNDSHHTGGQLSNGRWVAISRYAHNLVWNGEVSDLAPTFKEVVNLLLQGHGKEVRGVGSVGMYIEFKPGEKHAAKVLTQPKPLTPSVTQDGCLGLMR